MSAPTSHTEVEAELLARALTPGARVLDAGCGRRTRLAGYRDRIGELVGVDRDARACADNDALDRVVVADLCARLPFPDASFDVVYTNFVIEHLDTPATAFAEWRRVLKSDGALILLTSNCSNPVIAMGRLLPNRLRLKLKRAGARVAEQDVIPARYQANTPRRLHTLLTRAGFDAERVEYVATLHRYAERTPKVAMMLRYLEQHGPQKTRSTIVAYYRAI